MTELFSNPLWVYLGVAAITGLVMLWPAAETRRREALEQFAELELIEPMLPANAARIRLARLVLRLAALSFLFLAIAGPRWGVEILPGDEFGVHVVLGVDVSGSMASQDVKPTRLEKAKRELSSLIDSLQGNRVGIVAFSGMAAIQCPLTTDLNAAEMFLSAMHTDMLPVKGTAIGDAIRLGTKMLAPYPGTKGLVLFTDGEDHGSDPLGAAKEAAAYGVRIYALGIGNPEGEPIPILDGSGATSGYRRDDKGKVVLSKLDEGTLTQVAELTGGAYYRATASEAEVSDILSKVHSLDQSRMTSGIKERLRDRTQLPLAIALLLFLIELLIPISFPLPEGERSAEGRVRGQRESVIPLAVLLVLAFCSVSRADSLNGEIRKGNRHLDNEQFDEALGAYGRAKELAPGDSRPVYNEGVALYRLKKSSDAAGAFHEAAEAAQDPGFKRASVYNEGNAVYKADKPDEAAKIYRKLILESPNDPVVRHNLQMALKKKEQQKQDKQDDKDKKDDKKDQSKSKQDQSKSKPPQGGMTKEDAERVLKSQEEKEKSNADPKQYNRAGQQKPNKGNGQPEDW